MKLAGTKTQEIEVDITTQEMIRGLYYEAGLGCVYNSNNTYWWQEDDGGKLYEVEDISYHGSPRDRPTGKVIDEPLKLRAYYLLKELSKVMERIENGDYE